MPLQPERLKTLLYLSTDDEDFADRQAAILLADQIRAETEARRA